MDESDAGSTQQPLETPPATPGTISPLGPLKAFTVLLAFFGSQCLAGLVIGIVAAAWFMIRRGGAGPDVIAESQRAVVMPAVLFAATLSGLLAVGLTWLWIRGSEPGQRAIGWALAPRRDVLAAGLLGAALGLLYVYAAAVFPPAPGQRFGPVTQLASAGGWHRHVWACVALLVAPPVEEFVFRGVLFGGLSRSWSALSAGTVVTLLFLAGHVTEIWGYTPALVAIATLGAAAMQARVVTGSLLPAVVLHFAYNLVLVTSMYAGRG